MRLHSSILSKILSLSSYYVLLVAVIMLERHWLAVEELAATTLVETQLAVVKLEEETVSG